MRAALAVMLALLGGCAAVGPEPVAPARPQAGAFLEAGPAATATAVPADWWKLFEDPALDALVTDALAANADLRVAEANLRRVEAASREARAARLPSTTVQGAVDVDEDTPDPGDDVDTFDAGLHASYQLDLVGKVRRAVQAARADAEAEWAVMQAVRVTVAAETAGAYADACGLGARLAAARAARDAQDRLADLTERRRTEGAASGYELAQARALAESSGAEIPPLEAARAAALYRLARLTGRAPAEVPAAARACASAPRTPAPLPIGDGAALLGRRPDVREAEQRVLAATARIGVARAELYPDVTIGLAAGAGGETADEIGFKWSAAPLVRWTFPNQAAVRARIGQAEAAQAAALARWNGVVLGALSEAETALSAYARALDRVAALKRAGEADEATLRRGHARRREGAISLFEVLELERQAAQTRALLAQAEAEVASRQVGLFLALGGGWR